MDKYIEKIFVLNKKKKLFFMSSFNLKKNIRKINYYNSIYSNKFLFNLLSEPILFEKDNNLLINTDFKKNMNHDNNMMRYNLLDYIIYTCFYIIFCKIKLIKLMKIIYKINKNDCEYVPMNTYIYNRKKYSIWQFYLSIEILHLIFSNIKYVPFNSIKLILDIFLNKIYISICTHDIKEKKNLNKLQNIFYDFFCQTFYTYPETFTHLPHFIYQYQKTLHLLNLLSNSVVCKKKKQTPSYYSLILEIMKTCFPKIDSDDVNEENGKKKVEEKQGIEKSQRMLRSNKANKT